jgi:hypothetical protein
MRKENDSNAQFLMCAQGHWLARMSFPREPIGFVSSPRDRNVKHTFAV